MKKIRPRYSEKRRRGFLFLFFLFNILLMYSCRAAAIPMEYKPNPLNIQDPIKVIKETIEQQPPAYAYMPVHVGVDKSCIKLYMPGEMPIYFGSNSTVIVGPPSSENVRLEPVCYKNIGRVGLSYIKKKKVWRVEIDDVEGNYMYWVYSYQKSDAERFIDAISNYVKSPVKENTGLQLD